MKTTLFAGLVAATLTVSTTALFAVADEAPAAKPTENKTAAQPVEEVPVGIIKGTVTARIGQLDSFMPPRIGEKFELDLRDLTKIKEQLGFQREHQEYRHYIPFAAPFAYSSIRWETKTNWNYLRAVSYSDVDKIKVTFQVYKNGGKEDPNYVTVLILSESEGSINGLVEIVGQVTPE